MKQLDFLLYFSFSISIIEMNQSKKFLKSIYTSMFNNYYQVKK